MADSDEPDVVVIDGTSVGTVVYALPAGCPRVVRANLTYFSCNNVWYQPQYQSSGVSYVIVNPPG